MFASLCLMSRSENQVLTNFSKDPCSGKRTCHECMQTKNCAWCMEPNIGNKPNCFQSDHNEFCKKSFIWNPKSNHHASVNRKLTQGGHVKTNQEQSDDIIQISPQRVTIKLRLNEVYSLPFRYSQAVDYPVDLYYLMDMSKSMEDDKEKLSSLGNLLSETMRNISSNFRLGFGSFVDKMLTPFVMTTSARLTAPCKGCAGPYGFKNVMPLSTDTLKFSTEVKNTSISGNLDDPEGGLDALMQAIVCRERIGWREKARRLLVFATDNGFHYAGDGKLGGVILPNDAECHLNEDGNYTHSAVQDYPSIAQINRKVKENSINIIFAVTSSHRAIYKKLAKTIEGSSTVTLSKDSSNVVGLVRKEYGKISSSIEMKDNATGYVKIIYYSACLSGGSELPTAKCDGLKVGDIIKFTAQILVNSCPNDPADWHQVIQVYPVGINESLILDVEILCSCPCESPGSNGYAVNSSICNNHGTEMCGICASCDDLNYGRNCECSAADTYTKKYKDFGCRGENSTTVDCNGRGTCLCGICECEKRSDPEEIISSRYCECDNFSCDRQDQLLCSGSDHGVCECGSCVCKPGWTGAACDCISSIDTCISPDSGEVCSGRGKCECGICKCKSTKARRYSGNFCEECSTCSSRCHEFKDCVQCQMFKTGPLKNSTDCAAYCTAFVTKSIEKVEVDEEKGDNICKFYDEMDCMFIFKYREEGKEKLEVNAEPNRKCRPEIFVFILGFVLAIIGSIVLVGLGTLVLWKLLTTIHDRREFAKFEKERANANWNSGENPLYTPAITTFENPTYCED